MLAYSAWAVGFGLSLGKRITGVSEVSAMGARAIETGIVAVVGVLLSISLFRPFTDAIWSVASDSMQQTLASPDLGGIERATLVLLGALAEVSFMLAPVPLIVSAYNSVKQYMGL